MNLKGLGKRLQHDNKVDSILLRLKIYIYKKNQKHITKSFNTFGIYNRVKKMFHALYALYNGDVGVA